MWNRLSAVSKLNQVISQRVLRVDKSVLENAKGFDKEKWSLTRDELADAYKRCGLQPYWK